MDNVMVTRRSYRNAASAASRKCHSSTPLPAKTSLDKKNIRSARQLLTHPTNLAQFSIHDISTF